MPFSASHCLPFRGEEESTHSLDSSWQLLRAHGICQVLSFVNVLLFSGIWNKGWQSWTWQPNITQAEREEKPGLWAPLHYCTYIGGQTRVCERTHFISLSCWTFPDALGVYLFNDESTSAVFLSPSSPHLFFISPCSSARSLDSFQYCSSSLCPSLYHTL